MFFNKTKEIIKLNKLLAEAEEKCCVLNVKILERNSQIEKMKNKCNCKYGKYSNVGPASFECTKGIGWCKGCKEWELAND